MRDELDGAHRAVADAKRLVEEEKGARGGRGPSLGAADCVAPRARSSVQQRRRSASSARRMRRGWQKSRRTSSSSRSTTTWCAGARGPGYDGHIAALTRWHPPGARAAPARAAGPPHTLRGVDRLAARGGASLRAVHPDRGFPCVAHMPPAVRKGRCHSRSRRRQGPRRPPGCSRTLTRCVCARRLPRTLGSSCACSARRKTSPRRRPPRSARYVERTSIG